MANWDKLKSLVDQMNDELYSENVSSSSDVELKNMNRNIEQYWFDLNADINTEKELIELNHKNGLTINAIEQEGYLRGLMYALYNFEYFFGKKPE